MNNTKNVFNLIKKRISLVIIFCLSVSVIFSASTAVKASVRIPVDKSDTADTSLVDNRGQQESTDSGGGGKNIGWENWKQYEGSWSDILYVSKSHGYKFGDHVGKANEAKGWGTIHDWGCYLVAMSIQIARSGAKTGFTPWDFVKYMHNNGFMNKADDSEVQNEKGGVSGFTGNKFRVHNPFKLEVGGKSKSAKIKAIKTALDSGLYPIVRINRGSSGYHFVAINKVSGNTVYTFDPGSSSNDLFKKYGNTVDQIRVFESDVPSNKADGSAQGGKATSPKSKPSSDPNETVDVSTYAWDEGKIPGMPKPKNWNEDPVPISQLKDLSSDETDSLEKWKDENQQFDENTAVTVDRVITMIMGIAMLLFSLVYLVAFVFDRITITEFRAMDFLTKHKLAVSATGESTFLRGGHTYPKLVNTRDLVIIEFLMIGVSVLILNGGIFAIISWVVSTIQYLQSLITW